MKTPVVSVMAALAVLASAAVPAAATAPAAAEPTAAEPSAAAVVLDTRFGIAEGFRNPAFMAESRAGWERVVIGWDAVQPNGPGDFGQLGFTLPKDVLQAELNRGTRMAAVLQFTPEWAAKHPQGGKRSVPRNLDLPFDHPDNYWGQFVYQTVKHYAGRINEWIIWNEPEIAFDPAHPSDMSYTWLGTDEEFAQLTRVGYLAAKRANPNAVVSFAGTAFFREYNERKTQFYERYLAIVSTDPDAAANNYYHDAVSLNLYYNPDGMVTVHHWFKRIQQKFGIDRPIWLTETNAPPSFDPAIPCPNKFAENMIKTTLEQQAAYMVQTFALAAAAGFQRIGFYKSVDGNPCNESAIWGVARDDGSRRPVFDSLKTAIGAFSGFTNARFVPRERETANWPAYPADLESLTPNWQLYQVALDRPGNQRVTVLWNGDGAVVRTRIPKHGTSARLLDMSGAVQPLQENQGWWVVDLPAATAKHPLDYDGYYFIGGNPLLIVEEGVDPATPVIAPRLGDPGSVPREFRIFVSGSELTVTRGEPAEFSLTSRGYEDFTDPISLRISQWSTQRDPTPRDGSSFPLGTTISPSDTIEPGRSATIRFETGGAEPGIYYITVEGAASGITKSVELALVLN